MGPKLNSVETNEMTETVATRDIWQSLRQQLRERMGETAFRRWMEPVVGKVSEQNGQPLLTLALPTRFMCDWVEAHYGDMVRAMAHQASPNGDVTFTVEAPLAKPRPLTTSPVANITPMPVAAAVERMPTAPGSGLEDISSSLDPRFTFENFVVGKPNELAYAAARRVADTETPSFNPLFLYGGVGLGKTHLMHAIAWHIRKNFPHRRVIYMSAEKFMYQFVRALRYKDMVSFKEQFRTVDVLMIDDVQFIGGKDSTQEEFFHTFNALVDRSPTTNRPA